MRKTKVKRSLPKSLLRVLKPLQALCPSSLYLRYPIAL